MTKEICIRSIVCAYTLLILRVIIYHPKNMIFSLLRCVSRLITDIFLSHAKCRANRPKMRARGENNFARRRVARVQLSIQICTAPFFFCLPSPIVISGQGDIRNEYSFSDTCMCNGTSNKLMWATFPCECVIRIRVRPPRRANIARSLARALRVIL